MIDFKGVCWEMEGDYYFELEFNFGGRRKSGGKVGRFQEYSCLKFFVYFYMFDQFVLEKII